MILCFQVYGLSWLVIIVVVLVLKVNVICPLVFKSKQLLSFKKGSVHVKLLIRIVLQVVSMGRKKFSADYQLMFRLLKLSLFIGSVGTLAVLFTVLHLTVGDIFASFLAFAPTGWAILQVHPSALPLQFQLLNPKFHLLALVSIHKICQ